MPTMNNIIFEVAFMLSTIEHLSFYEISEIHNFKGMLINKEFKDESKKSNRSIHL